MSAKAKQSIVARRTPEIESQLQELWSLRPELAELGKVTILLALAALIRESRRMLTTSPDVPIGLAASEKEAKQENTIESADTTELVEKIESADAPQLSDDAEWTR